MTLPSGATRDFATITERWEMPMTAEQLAMAQRRYALARELTGSRDILEIGCGTGFGLDYLTRSARTAIGGDVTERNLREALQRAPHLHVARFDATALPFRDASFDTVAMFEVIYYLPDVVAALREARRVLRPGGAVALCLPNRDRPGFHASPFATSYPDVPELAARLRSADLEAEIFGAFPLENSVKHRAIRAAATIAERAGVVPRSLGGRAKLKRLLFGPLIPLHRLEDPPRLEPLVPLDPERPTTLYKNLYAVGHRPES